MCVPHHRAATGRGSGLDLGPLSTLSALEVGPNHREHWASITNE